MSYIILGCKKCGELIGQCRCPERNKEKRLGICTKCSQQVTEVPLKEYENHVAKMNPPHERTVEEKIRNYLACLSPHIKERKGHKLLIDALDSIEAESNARLKAEKEVERLTKEVIVEVYKQSNNYCPCCHAALDSISGPCKWCKNKHFDTERTMHNAWRKRAEEAELELSTEKTKREEAEKELEDKLFYYESYLDGNHGKFPEIIKKLDDLEASLSKVSQERDAEIKRAREAEAKVKELESRLTLSETDSNNLAKALNFYAAERHYTDEGICFKTVSTPSTPDSLPEGIDEVDYGQIAREALHLHNERKSK